jgi:hypothetical protein
LISTIPWLTRLIPTQRRLSLPYVLLVFNWVLCSPQSVSLFGHAPPRHPTVRLARDIFEPNLYPYKSPNNLTPVIQQPQCCGCGGNHTASYRGCVKWKEAKAAVAKRAPEDVRKSAARSAAPKAQRAGPSAEQTDLGEGWNHVVRGGRVVKTTNIQPNPKTSPQPVTEAPSQPKVTATRKTAGSQKPKPKSTAATKPAAGKSKNKAASVKTAAAKPTTSELVVHTQFPTSPLEEISDLLDHLPIQACVELTRRLLSPPPPSPQGQSAHGLS